MRRGVRRGGKGGGARGSKCEADERAAVCSHPILFTETKLMGCSDPVGVVEVAKSTQQCAYRIKRICHGGRRNSGLDFYWRSVSRCP